MKYCVSLLSVCLCAPLLLAAPPAPAAAPVSAPGKPLIIPQPKSLRLGAGTFRLEPGMKWTLRAAARDPRLWQAAEAAFPGAPGAFTRSRSPGVVLQIGSPRQTVFPAGQARWAQDPEGYRLVVEPGGLAILASTAQGAFYGLQTLAQLWAPAGRARTCPALEVDDWPALRFRGAHWFPSASGAPMHQRLITNVFSALKFNHSLIQCEAARWDKHPEITAPNAISKPDLRHLVELCRAHYQEPVPLINVPGHAEWIFRNHSNLGFAEDPQTPYAYCVRHPHSFRFIRDVLKECLPIFQSQSCHIGHDEVTMRGRFPNPECPRCRDETVTTLVVEHANRLARWLERRGVQSMIWGDMLLGPGEASDATHAKTRAEAQQRRAQINKRITIVDWHYAAAADDRSFKLLHEAGFRVIAASWYTPENIRRLTQAALQAGVEGLLQTTWMGFFPDERALESQPQQFAAFVLAAEYAWSGRADAPDQLGYDPGKVFQEAYRHRLAGAATPRTP